MKSPNLKLPYLDAAQALKHITHNEALQRLDACVQLSVLSRASALYVFSGSAWVAAGSALLSGSVFQLGINGTADAYNRLLVHSPAALFDNDGTNHRLSINKAAMANTASIVFQTGYSGHAEIGLAGDDHLVFKTSPDGSAWSEALRTNSATGRVIFPAGVGGVAMPIMGQ